MWEYDVFMNGPDDPRWTTRSCFRVWAVSDEAVRTAYPQADRIYRLGRNCGAVCIWQSAGSDFGNE